MLQPSTIQLLRFHFSVFLLPVFLFAVSEVKDVNFTNLLQLFIILHLLVYPSSNGYNSYMDRDTTPIGGLAKPMQPTMQLFWVSVVFDVVAVVWSSFISWYCSAGVLLYILASRAYSNRAIRLKQYAIIGYLVVFIFQGAVIFWITYHSITINLTTHVPVTGMLAASCLIGSFYPLTQVYQHAQDKADNVTTISMLMGKRGSFVFTALLFSVAATCLWLLAYQKNELHRVWLFVLITLPALLYFFNWAYKVWKDEQAANFKNSLWMNVIASGCTTIYFITLILIQ
jgi:1,4-dihydroxy-2-naphthoate polyprenyltransferase